jgi:hypothetical protein
MIPVVACPKGHQSAAADYCDICGANVSFSVAGMTIEPVAGTPKSKDNEPCPRCDAPSMGDDAFCENCGHEFGTSDTSEEPAPRLAWELLITADPDYYARHPRHDVEFPAVTVSRVVRLEEAEIQIGRRSDSRGLRPHVDCSIPPADPAISHLHAVLIRNDGGSYALCDLGSTNGTTLNGEIVPIATNTLVNLHDGDRIHIGAWTTLTIRSSDSSGGIPS